MPWTGELAATDVVESGLDKELLQRDLDKLSNWANDWRMKFRVDKCRVNDEFLMNGV